MKMLAALTLSAGLVIISINQRTDAAFVIAQNGSTLSQAWLDGNGFTSFQWLRAEDRGKLHSSVVYTEVKQNTLKIYNTYQRDPMGKNARCGGLGCDLNKGQLVGTLNFESRGGTFTVRSASGNTAYLKGARCRLTQNFMQTLECTSNQNPANTNMTSIFLFVPGT